MKLQETALRMLKSVAGVFHVRPIIPDRALTLRKGRRGHELIQNEGEAVRVVAVGDDKPGLLSFAALNGIPVKNYTDMAVPKPETTNKDAAQVPELSM
ncbi:MAG: hypothetical protein IH623_09915 [Verrucomicrobia bacterium]|jgi:hypothetical protein|nr:hypothetical protein [Verrucomicrobiota bacterium]